MAHLVAMVAMHRVDMEVKILAVAVVAALITTLTMKGVMVAQVLLLCLIKIC